MQNKWTEEAAQMTFRPEIPAESLQLLKKNRVRLTLPSDDYVLFSLHGGGGEGGGSVGEASAESSRGRQAAHERLHNTTIICQDDKFLAEQKAPSKIVNPVEHNKFINRLTYEYLVRSERQEQLRRHVQGTDAATGRPLFQPTVSRALHLSEEDSVCSETGPGAGAGAGASVGGESAMNREKIYEKLLRKGEEHKMRMRKLQEDFLSKEERAQKASVKHSLPESVRILEQSSENSIGEIFKVLLTCQMHNEARQAPDASELTRQAQGLDPEVLLKVSLQLSSWPQGVLNIAAADPDLMIESVQSLLAEVMQLSEHRNSNAEYPEIYSKYDKPVLLDLPLFSEHIWSCVQRREGGGKSYLFLPRRDVSPTKQEVTPPFKPVIDSKSRRLAGYRDPSVSVEDSLLQGYEHTMLRFEDVKRDLEHERYSECTFQPQIYRPPLSGSRPAPRYTQRGGDSYSSAPPPPPAAGAGAGKPLQQKSCSQQTQNNQKKGVVVSSSLTPFPTQHKNKKLEEAVSPTGSQHYDFENDSVGNDSLTVPRHSIASNLTIDSPPELKPAPSKTLSSNAVRTGAAGYGARPGASGQKGRDSDSSGGVSMYSPPWIKK
jgi:hypothetical protein